MTKEKTNNQKGKQTKFAEDTEIDKMVKIHRSYPNGQLMYINYQKLARIEVKSKQCRHQDSHVSLAKFYECGDTNCYHG